MPGLEGVSLSPDAGAPGETTLRLNWLVVTAGCLMALLALILGVSALLPYQALLRLARFATGSRNPVSEADFNLLGPRLLEAAVFFVGFALVLILCRRPIAV